MTNLVFLLLLFACVVAHEFGDIFMARAFGVATPDVLVAADRWRRAPRANSGRAARGVLIAIAGPLSTLPSPSAWCCSTGARLKAGDLPSWKARSSRSSTGSPR